MAVTADAPAAPQDIEPQFSAQKPTGKTVVVRYGAAHALKVTVKGTAADRELATTAKIWTYASDYGLFAVSNR